MTAYKKEYARQWREKNSVKMRQYFKDRYLSNKEAILRASKIRYENNKAGILAKNRDYFLKHRDKLEAAAKEYRKINSSRIVSRVRLYAAKYPDRVRAYKKKWQDAHKHENLMKVKARRAKLKIGKEQQQAVSEFYRWIKNQDFVTCTYCGLFISGTSVHIDHIVPVSRGGEHSVDNFAVSCHSCNRNKAAMLLSEWPRCPDKFKSN